MHLAKPIIVLNEPLIGVSLQDEDIAIEELKYTTVDFRFKSKNYTRGGV